MGGYFADIGELLFSLVISYMSVLEFLYVVRHLYHWSFRHPNEAENDEESLKQLQENLRGQLSEAKAKEILAGNNVMKDGVLYKDGFRIDPDREEIEKLTNRHKQKEEKDLRRQEIEEELEKQRRIEEETRRQLEEAEANLALELTRKNEAEQLERQREAEGAENEQKLLEAERKREEEERRLEAERQAAENAQKLLEEEKERERIQVELERRKAEERKIAENAQDAQRKHEEEQRKLEDDQQATQMLLETEREGERGEDKNRQKEAEGKMVAENKRKLLEGEQELEEKQQRLETDQEAIEKVQQQVERNQSSEDDIKQEDAEDREAIENERDLVEAERRYEKEQQQKEVNLQTAEDTKMGERIGELLSDNEELVDDGGQLLDVEKRLEEQLRGYEESVGRERAVSGLAVCEEEEEEAKIRERIIEENAKKFLEAEREMVALQEKMLKAAEQPESMTMVDSEPQSPVVEEPCIKKVINPHLTNQQDSENERVTQTVKTQFGQTKSEPYSVTTKPLLFPGISDDGSSIDPYSSKQSSFSTQPSDDFTTATDEVTSTVELQFPQQERQEPDGEDTTPSIQYTDDYLRSLDGIKNKPLVREDGSGRRRAFKKRRSSGSSVSSRESRTSRDEELKMFTSLEEEELQGLQKGEDDFTPIKYSTEQKLKVKGHHRRHKKSPAKDMKAGEESLRSSLERLGEENTDPWGEVIPEHYKETEFWKREKAMSIDEEEIELEKSIVDAFETATNVPKSSSFEKATTIQNEEAVSTLQKTQSNEDKEEQNKSLSAKDHEETESEPNLQSSQKTEPNVSPARSSASPRLRRSPRIDEMDHYEERWIEKTETEPKSESQSTVNTPTISIEPASDAGPWRDQYGLIMEGLSDFYDFTASVNPSRSRSTSRNPSPVNSQPSSPIPKNVSHFFDTGSAKESSTIDVYDDTGIVEEIEVRRDNIIELIESLNGNNEEINVEVITSSEISHNDGTHNNELRLVMQEVADEPNREFSVEEGKSSVIVPVLCINDGDGGSDITEWDNEGEMRKLRASRERSRSRSRSSSPLPTGENIERSLKSRRDKLIKHNEDIFERLTNSRGSSSGRVDNLVHEEILPSSGDDNSKESISALVESLRAERSRSTSRSRSRSPLPTAENIQRSLESRRNKRIQHNDEIFEKLNATGTESITEMSLHSPEIPIISVEDVEVNNYSECEDIECSRENMSKLVESIRIKQSRSRSRTPIRTIEEGELNKDDELFEKESNRSRTPSRSLSPEDDQVLHMEEYNFIERQLTKPNSHNVDSGDCYDFHKMLNLEASVNRTLVKNSEEFESLQAQKLRQMDLEALQKLKTAQEETELRTFTPLALGDNEASGEEEVAEKESDHLSHLSVNERLRQLRCSPTTPDYDRTISEEWKDVQRIKDDLLRSGFKRSTYVGESLELGSEYEPLRREAANFERSRSPTPSIDESQLSGCRDIAAEKRKVQDAILAELANASGSVKDESGDGTKPKSVTPIQGGSVDLNEYEEMRREMADFRRSQSKSRSPLNDDEVKMIQKIDAEAVKRELRDKLFENIEETSRKYQDFSRHLNVDFLDDRRASDSALIQKPEVLIHFQDTDVDLEPEEYHHFRRFSLDLEQPTEEYPNDDYVYVSQIEVRTPTGTRTWIREDYYSNDFKGIGVNLSDSEIDQELFSEEEILNRDEDESDGSEDERQTVVEVDDEIDEDINDFNERGPAEESHHEQSECEEAEREVDHYAGREANDWKEVETDNEGGNNVGGAVGGTSSDSDSFAIDQIYNDAIKNRKQSGILRDFDSILSELQDNPMKNNSEPDIADSDRYALWAKSRDLERSGSGTQRSNGVESSIGLLENERREYELRYLGDANVSARQSTRLRSRYGYVPVLQTTTTDEMDVDVNYKPKREYNWRKNFRIDEDESRDMDAELNTDWESNLDNVEGASHQHLLDIRKYSLGGESITLFSRSPDRNQPTSKDQYEEDNISKEVNVERVIHENYEQEIFIESEGIVDKPKKKKSKKKTRKNSKSNIEYVMGTEDNTESQTYSRRSSSVQFETDSPKRKSYSRRSSRASITTAEETDILFSPRGSIGFDNQLVEDIIEENEAEPMKKKTKRRKKVKDLKSSNSVSLEENSTAGYLAEPQPYRLEPISGTITPDSAGANILSALSPQQYSVSGTPVHTDVEAEDMVKIAPSSINVTRSTVAATDTQEATRSSTSTTTTATSAATGSGTRRTPLDTFDILKDANFYPLF